MTRAARVVVVGASIGGLTAAETLRQEGFDGEIVLIGDERHLPYNRPPLSKQILLGDWEPHQAAIRTAAEAADLAIELRTSCSALALDVAAHLVRTTQGEIAFDELVIATGSEPRRHPLLSTALTLRTMDDALALRDEMRSARRVGIVGAGVLGSEVASAARKNDTDVVLVGRSGALRFGAVGTLLSKRLVALHQNHGVRLRLSESILGAERTANGTRVLLADGDETVDLLVAMIGSTPRTAWLASSALRIADGIVCDSAGRAAPGVSAVGDVAAWEDPFTGLPARVEHQSNAIEQAIAVAIRIVRGQLGTAPVPLFWSEIHGTRIQACGWFPSDRTLVSPAGEDAPSPSLLQSTDDEGRVRGVVGWDAAPREFRAARGTVLTATSILTPS